MIHHKVLYANETELSEIPNNERESRPPFKFSGGAIYTGEWKGNARDGFGE